MHFSVCLGFGYGYQVLKLDIDCDGGIRTLYMILAEKFLSHWTCHIFARFRGWTVLLYLYLFTLLMCSLLRVTKYICTVFGYVVAFVTVFLRDGMPLSGRILHWRTGAPTQVYFSRNNTFLGMLHFCHVFSASVFYFVFCLYEPSELSRSIHEHMALQLASVM